MFIYRQEYYEERGEPKSTGTETSVAFTERYIKWQENLEKCKSIANIIIAKQRHGPIGSLQLHFDSKFTKFSNNLADDKQQTNQFNLKDLNTSHSALLLVSLENIKKIINF